MGWGTEFTTDVYLSRIVLKTIPETDDKIDEVLTDCKFIEDRIKMYCSSTPKDIILDESIGDTAVDAIHNLIYQDLEELRELYFLLDKLYLFKKYLEEGGSV